MKGYLRPGWICLMALGVAVMPGTAGCSRPGAPPTGADDGPGRYLSWSRFTDPGEQGPALQTLPADFDQLCAVVRRQIVHAADVFPGSEQGPRAEQDRAFFRRSFRDLSTLERQELDVLALLLSHRPSVPELVEFYKNSEGLRLPSIEGDPLSFVHSDRARGPQTGK